MPSASAAGEGHKVPVPGPWYHPRALSPSQSLAISIGGSPQPVPPPPSTRRAGAGNFSSAFRHPGRLQLTKPRFPLPHVLFLTKTNAGRCGSSRSRALDDSQLQDIFLTLSPAGQKQASKCRRGERGSSRELPSLPLPCSLPFPCRVNQKRRGEEVESRAGCRHPAPKQPRDGCRVLSMPQTAPRARSCSTPQQNAARRENPAPSQGWITEAGS